MKVEITIREILYSKETPEQKAELICRFMSWNKDKLIEAIRKYGTQTNEQRTSIIREFWNDETLHTKQTP